MQECIRDRAFPFLGGDFHEEPGRHPGFLRRSRAARPSDSLGGHDPGRQGRRRTRFSHEERGMLHARSRYRIGKPPDPRSGGKRAGHIRDTGGCRRLQKSRDPGHGSLYFRPARRNARHRRKNHIFRALSRSRLPAVLPGRALSRNAPRRRGY